MPDILILQERAKHTIDLRESHFREFKSAWMGMEGDKKPRATKSICEDIGEALVAFANADGGELIIGVEDHGAITGVPHSEEQMQQMLSAPRTHVHEESNIPLVYAEKLTIDDNVILFFSVTKGTEMVFQLPDGRCVIRKDKETVPGTPRQINFERHEIRSREYDRQFVDGATVTDLDTALVQSLADNYLRGLSVERYLQQIGVAEYAASGLRLRMAALLLFAKDIQRWHPRSQVRVLKVEGEQLGSGDNYNVSSDELVRGNVFELLVTAWDILRPFLAYKTEFGTDAKFVQKYIYPEDACREAIVNTIAHRDYCIQSGIDVFIYDNRMEIRNPGSLLSTLSIEDLEALQGAHESRNSLVARGLRENDFIRELGEGLKRIYLLMEESELEKPTLHSDTTSFKIMLPQQSVFSDRQLEWLNLFAKYNLTRLQKKIVVSGMDDRKISPSDIYNAMNTNDRDTYDREVTALRETGVLQQIMSNVGASTESRKRNIPKKDIARFKIDVPKTYSEDELSKGVFVVNLKSHVSHTAVKALFGQCGTVEQVDLPRENGRSKGYGFVWYESAKSAKRALRELDRRDFQGREIKVDKIRPKVQNHRT